MAKTRPKPPPPKARKTKGDDAAQYERFQQAAPEVETNDDPEAFDRQFRKIVPSKDHS